MNLGLSLGFTGKTGSGGSAPATPPTIVDSIQADGSAGSITSGNITATGSNRYVFAMIGAGTSDAVSDNFVLY